MALYVTNPIKFKAYGEGDAPVFRGSVEVQNETWADEGSGVYSLETSFHVLWLQIDGQNAKFASTDWIDIADLPSDDTVEVDPDDLSGLGVVGAWAASWNRPWSLSRGHLVTGYSNGVITLRRSHGVLDRTWLTKAGAMGSVDGRIKLYGLSDYITADYDWAFEGGKLYVKLPSDPSNFVIRAVKEETAIKVKAANVEIDGIELMDNHRSAVTLYKQADNAVVRNCYIHHNREDGVRVTDRNDSVQVVDNEIAYCDVRGISLSNLENSKHNGNHIHHIGVGVNDVWMKDATDTRHQAGMALTQANGLTLDNPAVNSIEINDNYVHDTAYHGLHCTKSTGKVLRNRIENVMKVFVDGGGIYSAWGLYDYPEKTYSMEIAYNRISGIASGFAPTRFGIYEDNGAGPNHVHHNVIFDFKGTTQYGAIKCSVGSSFNNWHDNIIITKTGHCIRHQFDDYPGGHGLEAQGVKMFDNIFITLHADYECIRMDGNVFQNGGDSDRNYFINPYSINRIAYNDLGITSWRNLYGTDANSVAKSNWLTYVNEATAENTHVKLYVNHTDTDVEQEIPAGYEDIDGNDVGGQTLTVPAHYGLVVLKSEN